VLVDILFPGSVVYAKDLQKKLGDDGTSSPGIAQLKKLHEFPVVTNLSPASQRFAGGAFAEKQTITPVGTLFPVALIVRCV
jgi:hypothetical protein